MPVRVYRCSHCGREVLVRAPGPLSEAEVQRRIEEEMRPAMRGPGGHRDPSIRLRDYIWEGVSATREFVPRDRLPERCPVCRRRTLEVTRTIEG